MATQTREPTTSSTLQRFSGVQVYFHALFAASILVLLITGLPITFHDQLWWVMALVGYQRVVNVHVLGAIALIVSTFYYATVLVLDVAVSRQLPAAAPKRRDVSEAIAYVRYSLGAGARPDSEKYTFLQKGEIWILALEVVAIGITGIFLWYRGLLVGRGSLLLIMRDVHAVIALTMLMGITFHLFVTHVTRFPLEESIFTGQVDTDRAREEWSEWADRTGDTTETDGGAVVDAGHAPRRLFTTGVVVALVVFLVLYTGALLRSILSPLPTRVYLLDQVGTGPFPGGIVSLVWTVGLNLVMVVLFASLVALGYGMVLRFRRGGDDR